MPSYYYSRLKGASSSIKECIVTIEPCNDVESAIYQFLSETKNIPLEHIKDYYTVSEIEPACIGCFNESFSQEDHMECPYGCLHDRNTCDLCSNY